MKRRPFLPTLAALVLGALVASPAPGQEKAEPTLQDEDAATVAELRRAGKFEEALAFLGEHPAVAAGEPRAVALKGLVLLDLDRFDEADPIAARFKVGVRTTPEVLLLVGRAKLAVGDPRGAEGRFSTALLYAPTSAEAELGKRHARAQILQDVPTAQAVFALEDRAGELPAGMFERIASQVGHTAGAKRLLEGNADEATLDLLARAAGWAPDDPTILLSLAHAHVLRHEFAESEHLLARIADRHPHRMQDVLYVRARTAEQQGDAERALTLANDAITLSRDHVPALTLAARLSLDLGRHDDASRYLSYLDARVINAEVARLHARYYCDRARQAEEQGKEGDRVLYLQQAETRCLAAINQDRFNVEALERMLWVAEQLGTRSKIVAANVERELKVAKALAAREE